MFLTNLEVILIISPYWLNTLLTSFSSKLTFKPFKTMVLFSPCKLMTFDFTYFSAFKVFPRTFSPFTALIISSTYSSSNYEMITSV